MNRVVHKYYKWNDSKTELSIKLGEDKTVLISNKKIIEFIANEEIEYKGLDGYPWRIGFKNDKVDLIWFNFENKFKLKGFNFSESSLEDTQNFMTSHFEEILELNDRLIKLNEYTECDVIFTIHSDFCFRLIGIKRKS